MLIENLNALHLLNVLLELCLDLLQIFVDLGCLSLCMRIALGILEYT